MKHAAKPRALHVTLLHDAWCDPFVGCTCVPDVVVAPLTLETAFEGARLERNLHDEIARRRAS